MTTKKKIVESLTEEQKQLMRKASPALNRQVGGDFTKIDSAERRDLLLRASPYARQPSMLWTKDRKLTRKFYVKRFLAFNHQLECEFADRASRVMGAVDQELDLAESNDVYFNMRCEESTLFFHVPRRSIISRNGLLVVTLPEDIYEIQRRAQLRYRSSAADDFRFESAIVPAEAEGVRVLDVSSGGIGIEMRLPTDAADAFSLASETRFKFRLDLGVLDFEAEGEARYVRNAVDEESGRPLVRIGIRFVGLSQDTVEAIQILVLEWSYFRLKDVFVD